MPEAMSRSKASSSCVWCRNQKAFAPPEHLLEKVKNEEVVLFVGAGVSTENKDHCQSTFYEEIRAELGISDRPTFPVLMSKYCALPDGRIKLIERIKQRFDYFKSFDAFYHPMTRFHRAISPLYMIRDIVTTNWDDFFERECLIDAFVHDSDLAFWDASPRRLMKIHGSITNFGSIIATTEDYKAAFERLNDGPLGAHLKSLIARKTVIYTGYSLSDETYLRLLSNIAKMMGESIRQSYFIAPNVDATMIANAPVPLIPMETDGAHFFECLRAHLSEHSEIVRDKAFQSCEEFLDEVIAQHIETADAYLRTKHPLLVFPLSYQDGLLHALKRINRQHKTGEYHDTKRVIATIHGYEHKASQFLKRRDYWNAAYAMGYQNGLMLLLFANYSDQYPTPPFFEFPFAVRAQSLKSALRFPRKRLPRYAAAQIRKMHRRFPGVGDNLIPDHIAYL
jgi:NAD-dependent SIR2 family protein deacetylase